MTDLTLLAGAAVFLAGMVTGRAWPSRKRKPKPVRPVCGCGHHHGYHHSETGVCGHRHESMTHYDVWDHAVYEQVPCGCQRYSGPLPMPEYFAPELTP